MGNLWAACEPLAPAITADYNGDQWIPKSLTTRRRLPYSFVDYSLKHASELAKADFNLDRMVSLRLISAAAGCLPVIHVAGTKGKVLPPRYVLPAEGGRLPDGSVLLTCWITLRRSSGRRADFHAELAELVDLVKPSVAKVPSHYI
jgi:hypothetical protein